MNSPCRYCSFLNLADYFCFKREKYINPDLIVECKDSNSPDYINQVTNQVKEASIKDSGERTQFDSGAVRDMHQGKGRFDLLPMCVLLRLARHYEQGAIKYSDRNWEKGIPAHSFADSALRHMVKYMDGYTDEDHLIAAIWNLCGLAWTEEKKPWLMDIPARKIAGEDDDDG